jgi:hypothetical protein
MTESKDSKSPKLDSPQPSQHRGKGWSRNVMQLAKQDARAQPWKKSFKEHDKGEIGEDWCNLKLPHDVQGNNMAA